MISGPSGFEFHVEKEIQTCGSVQEHSLNLSPPERFPRISIFVFEVALLRPRSVPLFFAVLLRHVFVHRTSRTDSRIRSVSVVSGAGNSVFESVDVCSVYQPERNTVEMRGGPSRDPQSDFDIKMVEVIL